MSFKIGTIIFAILALFVAKISLENLNSAQANEVKLTRVR